MSTAAPLLRSLVPSRRGSGAVLKKTPPLLYTNNTCVRAFEFQTFTRKTRCVRAGRGTRPFIFAGPTGERTGVKMRDGQVAFTIIAHNSRGVLQVSGHSTRHTDR